MDTPVPANHPGVNRVAANLVIGADGSTTLGGSSAGLSTKADRQRFHQLRQEFAAIVVGGNTAREEPYSRTPCPLLVISHQPLSGEAAKNPAALVFSGDVRQIVRDAGARYGDLLLEAGPTLLRSVIEAGLVTELFLTRSPISGGENRILVGDFITTFEEISCDEVDGTQFLHYRLAPSLE